MCLEWPAKQGDRGATSEIDGKSGTMAAPDTYVDGLVPGARSTSGATVTGISPSLVHNTEHIMLKIPCCEGVLEESVASPAEERNPREGGVENIREGEKAREKMREYGLSLIHI